MDIIKRNISSTQKFEFTLILNARLKPLAKNPPKGPMTDANIDMKNA